ncbi:MAG: hypothetical protein Q8O98_01725 [bacterium]|nr:hypothetical protein [bacterium]
MFVIRRSEKNPVLEPSGQYYWEAFATFNLSPVRRDGIIYGLYRAMSNRDKLLVPDQISTIGIAESEDGESFSKRRHFLGPKEEWEKYGCEDPRVTYFEGSYYIFYTALSTFPFSAEGIKVAVAVSDDLKKVNERHLITPFNAKAMALFPERIGGKVTAILSAHTDEGGARMALAQSDEVSDFWSEGYWEKWHEEIDKHTLNLHRDERDHVEVGAVPIKTEKGWLLIYSHIDNYFPGGGERLFGVEAVLLDPDDPRKIIGRTGGPILAPEEPYELKGHVDNIVFPSGALLEGEDLLIYYGAADTTTGMARVKLTHILSSISPDTTERYQFKRYSGNPTISPRDEHSWEAQATFNPAAIDLGGKVHILYRAFSKDNTSTIGYASSSDGLTVEERLPEPVYVPREDFEMKKIAGANSGCEDPRLTKIGERIYMCYTAFDGIGPPRVAVSSINEVDFLAKRWLWTKPILITSSDVDDKDTCLLPEKVSGKYLVLHRIGGDICGDYIDTLDFAPGVINKCIRILGPRHNLWDSGKVGISAPPVKTPKGWLLIYHAFSKTYHAYRLGAILLDLDDPTTVLSRSTDPIFEPKEPYEKEGLVPNVVFPCGMVVRDGLLYIYYGGADKVVGVATMELDILLKALS